MTDLTEGREAFEAWHYDFYGVPFDRFELQHAGRRSGWLNGLSWERNRKAGEQPAELEEAKDARRIQTIQEDVGLEPFNMTQSLAIIWKAFDRVMWYANKDSVAAVYDEAHEALDLLSRIIMRDDQPAKQDFGSAETCACPLPYRSIIPEQHIDSCPVLATKQRADTCLSSVSDNTVCVSETAENDGQSGRDGCAGKEGLAGEPISDYALVQLKLHIMETLLDDEPKKGARKLAQLIIRLNNAENQLRVTAKPSTLSGDERRYLLDSMREFIPSLSYHGKDLTGTYRADACCKQVLSAIEQKYHLVPKE